MSKKHSRMATKIITCVLFSILIYGGLFGYLFINNPNSINQSESRIKIKDHENHPNSANVIVPEDVKLYLNGVEKSGIPIVKRAIDTLNITYNDTHYMGGSYGAGNYKVNITLYGGSQFNLTMSAIPSQSNMWTALFTPSVTNTTGIATIAVMVVQLSGEIVEPPIFFDRQINIINNLPQLGVAMNTTEIYRGQDLKLNFTPSDIEDNVNELSWRVTLHKSNSIVNQTITDYSASPKVYGHILEIPTTFIAGEDWYINGTCLDSDGAKNSILYYFEVKNNYPIIKSIEFLVNGVEKSSNIEVSRLTDVLIVNITVEEEENINNLLMNFEAKDPITGSNVLLPLSNYQNIGPVDVSNGIFTKNMTFPTQMNCGLIDLKITIFESNHPEAKDEFTQSILVKNNPSEILDFKINGQSGVGLSFTKDQELNFTCIVYDVENRIDYIQIVMFHEEGNQYINYTTNFKGNNTGFNIRAVDLPSGDYIIYLYIIDDNGDITQSLPIVLTLNIDESIDPFVWLLFAIGIVIGLTVSFGLVYWRSRFRGSASKGEEIDEDVYSDNSKSKKQDLKLAKSVVRKNKSEISSQNQINKKEEKENRDINTNVTSEKAKKKLIRKL